MAVGFRHVYRTARYLQSCRYLSDLEGLIKVPKADISLHSLQPKYHEFSVIKKNGGYRKIEAPHPALMEVLRKFNFVLQCLYFFEMPKVSYGFILSHKGNKKPRNILTHAENHINTAHLLNVDLEDFFHHVNKERVFQIFNCAPFHFSKDSAEVLACLCTYKGRLPMGSPTSPVLSNFAVIPLDHTLENWAKQRKIRYTRFVDDMSFSSKNELPSSILSEICEILSGHELKLNPNKTKWFGPGEVKIVTGLEVSDKVRVPGSFYYELSQDLKRLKYCMEAQVLVLGHGKNELNNKFKAQVSGKLSFLQMILGYNDDKYLEYMEAYEKAINPELARFSMRWTDFPYHQF